MSSRGMGRPDAAALRNERFERMFGKSKFKRSMSTPDEEHALLRSVQGSASLQKLKASFKAPEKGAEQHRWVNEQEHAEVYEHGRRQLAEQARRARDEVRSQSAMRGGLTDEQIDQDAREAMALIRKTRQEINTSSVSTPEGKGKDEADLSPAAMKDLLTRELVEQADAWPESLSVGCASSEPSSRRSSMSTPRKTDASQHSASILDQRLRELEAMLDEYVTPAEEAAEIQALVEAVEDALASEQSELDMARAESALEHARVALSSIAAQLDASTSDEAGGIEASAPHKQEEQEEPVVETIPEKNQIMRFRVWKCGQSGSEFLRERSLREAAARLEKQDAARRKERDARLDELFGIQPAAPSPLAVLLGAQPEPARPSRTIPSSRKQRKKDEPQIEYSYDYPTSAELISSMGPRADFRSNVLAIDGSSLQAPPRNPGNMVCLRWQKHGVCEKWENSGWCSFDHPVSEDPSQKLKVQQSELDSIFLRAALDGDNQQLWQSLESGKVDVNVVAEPKPRSNKDGPGVSWELSGRSALSLAAKAGHLGAMRLLIERGASLKAQESELCSPLFAAIIPGGSEVEKNVEATLSLLLDASADLHEKTADGDQTLLLKAVDKRNFGIVETLLSLRADPNDSDSAGFSVLHLAVVRRDDRTIRRLLAAKANPNCQAHRKGICPGPSIMASACKSGQLDIIQALLAAGAVVDASSKVNSLAWEELQELREFQGVSMGDALNMDGTGVLHVAGQSLQLMEAVMPLMSEGELHEAAARRDENGVTPLMIAASMAADDSEAMGAVKELLALSGEHGGCRVRDHQGNTALHYTEDLVDCTQIVTALVNAGGQEIREIVNNNGQKPMLGLGRECPVQ